MYKVELTQSLNGELYKKKPNEWIGKILLYVVNMKSSYDSRQRKKYHWQETLVEGWRTLTFQIL